MKSEQCEMENMNIYGAYIKENKGNISGSILGGSGVIINVTPPQRSEPEQNYKVQKYHGTPISDRFLGIASSVLSILSFFTGFQTIRQAITAITELSELSIKTTYNKYWVIAFVFSIVLTIVGWSLFIFVRKKIFWFPKISFFPVLVGVQGNKNRSVIAIIRLSGHCSKCNGILRFYNKPVAFKSDNGKPIRWQAVAECKRNENHKFAIDITDTNYLRI